MRKQPCIQSKSYLETQFFLIFFLKGGGSGGAVEFVLTKGVGKLNTLIEKGLEGTLGVHRGGGRFEAGSQEVGGEII